MSDAKRSHPAIPLSPPSPPADGVRERTESPLPDYTPHSPASPYMSTTKNYGPSFAQSQTSHIPTAAQRSPSPPTSAPMSTQVSQQSSLAAVTSHPLPENNVIGQARKIPDEFEDEERVRKRLRVDEQVDDTQGHQSIHDSSTTEIDHDTSSWSTATHVVDTQITVPTCLGTQESANATAQPASDEMNLDQLHRNVGDLFHLCKSAIPRVRPDPSMHVLSHYDLSELHSKVARNDPETQEKINKLRKSYEGQIIKFELSGRNKPTKDDTPEGEWSSLNNMVLEPDDSWYSTNVMGKEIGVTSDFESRLRKALQMKPGRTKKHEQWADNLGHERRMPGSAQDINKLAHPSMHRPLSNGTTARPGQQSLSEAIRPRRTGKKRSYADDSFEGYGDGFVDDENADMDSSFMSNSEDGSRGMGRKKRKKVGDLTASGPGPTDRLSQEHSIAGSVQYQGGSSYGLGAWQGDR